MIAGMEAYNNDPAAREAYEDEKWEREKKVEPFDPLKHWQLGKPEGERTDNGTSEPNGWRRRPA
jgi:hypothetical protein